MEYIVLEGLLRDCSLLSYLGFEAAPAFPCRNLWDLEMYHLQFRVQQGEKGAAKHVGGQGKKVNI